VAVDEVTDRAGRVHTTTIRLPAVEVPGGSSMMADQYSVVVSPATARERGWTLDPVEGIVRPDRLPSAATLDRLQRRLGDDAGVYAERGYHTRIGLALLALIGAAGVAAVAGTSIAVALAMAESRADMATLAAVGAPPARRRVAAMAQAGTVGGLGAALGLALGSLVGVALLQGSTTYPFSLPVGWLLLLLAMTVLLAVAVAGVATRSRVVLTRRLT
jgi:putative ABC transport system permease protein